MSVVDGKVDALIIILLQNDNDKRLDLDVLYGMATFWLECNSLGEGTVYAATYSNIHTP